MKLALKTADNSELFLEHGQPVFIDTADTSSPWEYWPVDDVVPFDHSVTGWLLVNGVCTIQTALIGTNYRGRAKDDIAARRYEIENAGVVVAVSAGTYTFDTSRATRANWAMMQIQILGNPAFYMPNFKTNEGVFVTITAEDISAIITAGFTRVAQAFGRENQLTEQLAATADADLTTFSATVDQFWP